MEFDDYQMQAKRFAIYPVDMNIIYPALGLCGESGEVAEKIKKIIRDDGFIKTMMTKQPRLYAYPHKIEREIGDVLWYLSNLASDLGLSLSLIAENNIKKLEDRKERNVIKGEGDDR
tara:strand:- start:2097 stop:2447 length:351 start_codon:yes stop_codon:yes gene_type:complete